MNDLAIAEEPTWTGEVQYCGSHLGIGTAATGRIGQLVAEFRLVLVIRLARRHL